MPEEWGGKTGHRRSVGEQKQNIDLLLEMILLVTDIGELKANPKRNASGTVLEAKLDKGRGPVATVLVQDGTLPRRRHVHRRPDRRPRARAHRRPRAADKAAGAVDAGGSARPRRAAAAGRRAFQVADAAKARQHRDLPRGAGEERRSARRARGSRSNRCRRRSPKAA
jgi:translation initiation factor IF-2